MISIRKYNTQMLRARVIELIIFYHISLKLYVYVVLDIPLINIIPVETVASSNVNTGQ